VNSVTSKVILLAAIVGFSLGAIIASEGANAADEESILHEAVHDDVDDAYGTYWGAIKYSTRQSLQGQD
jgi:hypothetical protein